MTKGLPRYRFLSPFYCSFYGAIGWGTLASQLNGAGGDSFFFFGVYALAAIFQSFLFGPRFLHKGGAVEVLRGTERRAWIGGRSVKLDLSDQEENATLAEILEASGQFKIRLFAAIVLGICLVAMVTHQIVFRPTMLFHFFTAVTIVMAMNLNHFLVPLGLNTAAVIYSSTLETAAPPWFYAVYSVLIVAVFVLYRQLELETLFPAEIEDRGSARVWAAYRASAGEILRGASFLLVLLIPAQRAMTTLVGTVGEDGSRGGPDPITQSLRAALATVVPTGTAIAIHLIPSPLPSFAPPSARPSPIPKPTPTTVAATPTPAPGSTSTPKAGDGPGPSSGTEPRADAAPSAKPGSTGDEPGAARPSTSDLPDPVSLAVGGVVVAGLVFWFIRRRRLNRTGAIKGRLSRVLRMELQAEFDKLEKSKLAARDEVIARYALFQKIMAGADLPREDYVSPSEFSKQLVYLYPTLRVEAEVVTTVFSDVYYGGFSADAPRVAQLRQAVVAVFAHFC